MLTLDQAIRKQYRVTIDDINRAEHMDHLHELVTSRLFQLGTGWYPIAYHDLPDGTRAAEYPTYEELSEQHNDPVLKAAVQRWFDICEMTYGKVPKHIARHREPYQGRVKKLAVSAA